MPPLAGGEVAERTGKIRLDRLALHVVQQFQHAVELGFVGAGLQPGLHFVGKREHAHTVALLHSHIGQQQDGVDGVVHLRHVADRAAHHAAHVEQRHNILRPLGLKLG